MVYSTDWKEGETVHNTFTGCTPLGHAGEPDEAKLYCIRGRYLDMNTVEFHIIVPGLGFSPAYTATRVNGFQGDVAKIQIPSDRDIDNAIAGRIAMLRLRRSANPNLRLRISLSLLATDTNLANGRLKNFTSGRRSRSCNTLVYRRHC